MSDIEYVKLNPFPHIKLSGCLGILIIFIYIFLYPSIPMQDYPNWVYQGYILKQFFLGNGIESIGFHNYIPPNVTVTVFIGVLSLIFDIFFSAKLFLFIVTGTLYLGILNFINFPDDNWKNFANTFIALVLTFNFNYFHGNINFIFGLGISLLATSKFIKDKKVDFCFFAINSFLFLTHFIPFAIFNAYITLYCLYEKDFRRLKNIILLNIPLMVVFLHYVFAKNIGAFRIEPIDIESLIKQRIGMLHLSLDPIPIMQGLNEGESFKKMATLANKITFKIYCVIFMSYLFLTFLKKKFNFNFYFVLLLLLLFVLLPYNMCGIVRPGERVIIFMAVLVLHEVLKTKILSKLIQLVFVVVFLMQFPYINDLTYDYNNKHANIFTQTKGGGCHRVFLHRKFYKAIIENDVNQSFFPQGILKRTRN